MDYCRKIKEMPGRYTSNTRRWSIVEYGKKIF
jgi:hypothetical protein